MPYSDRLASRVRKALAEVRHVEEKKMFGGLAFMVEGHMALGVLDERLMCRCETGDYHELLGRRGAAPMDFTGRPLKGFLFVAPEGTSTGADLERWVKIGVGFARSRGRQAARARQARRQHFDDEDRAV